MLLQNHLHTWDLKCIVLSTIKVLVCNHVKPLFIVHCHLSAAAMHCYAEFDHETSRWSKACFFLVRWNNAGESSPFGKIWTFDHWASVGLDVASEACELIVTEELLGRPGYGDDVDSASAAVEVESRKSRKNARTVDIIIPNTVSKCWRTYIYVYIGTRMNRYLVPTEWKRTWSLEPWLIEAARNSTHCTIGRANC